MKQRDHRRSSTTLVSDIVSAAAEHAGTAPLALPPLYESVDADALEQLIATTSESDVTVTFTYAGVRLEVRSDGAVRAISSAEASD
ncbi:HalOD1 output domain-containing protein [Saliphagus sp. GCM10025308]